MKLELDTLTVETFPLEEGTTDDPTLASSYPRPITPLDPNRSRVVDSVCLCYV